jgi:DtxR family Mn-dependent transcriptional regulator
VRTPRLSPCIIRPDEGEKSVKTTAIAAKLDLTRPRSRSMTQKLASEALPQLREVQGRDAHPKGRAVARRIKRRHRLLERFLLDIVGMGKEEGHEEAMRLEHNVSERNGETINQLLNYPPCSPTATPSRSVRASPPRTSDFSRPLTDMSDGEQGRSPTSLARTPPRSSGSSPWASCPVGR